jgi:hypothetical protein
VLKGVNELYEQEPVAPALNNEPTASALGASAPGAGL